LPLYIDSPDDIITAAAAVRDGTLVATAFGNFYAILAAPSLESMHAVNKAKGRPADQVGSITTDAARIPAMFAAPMPDVLTALTATGPIGFRGPAAGHLPEHLTQVVDGIRTTQVVTPGTGCPSNTLFTLAAAEVGADHLYVTSANRSRHHTGAREEPAHWTAAGIKSDFAHVPGMTVIAHRDEAAARAAHPLHLPMSVTLLSFDGSSPELVVERHGSLHVSEVRRRAEPFGVQVRMGAGAANRLPMRAYAG
jgi:tRNA A37 threonylcarbamoyladenosine synthetase subunit TsaC/SUA5/YrdC